MTKALPRSNPQQACSGCGFLYQSYGALMNHARYNSNGCTEDRRFWGRVVKGPSCWIWTGALDQHGYGRTYHSVHGNQYAHRRAWEMANGPVPDGQHVLHTCDTPACVNPGHFFLGTHADNMADKKKKGREHRHRVNGRWAAINSIDTRTPK